MNLEPYSSVLDLEILRESHIDICMRMGYAILNVPKYDDKFSSLSHRLPWYQLRMKSFIQCGIIPSYALYCHAEGHVGLDYLQNVHFVFVGIILFVDILLLNAQKSRIGLLERLEKFPTTPQDRVNQDEVQQALSSIKFMSMNSPPAVSNVMGYKCSFQNESGDEFGDNWRGNDINTYPRYFNGSLPLMSIRKTTFR